MAEPMADASIENSGFAALKLPAALLEALDKVGYETPSPIQAEAIPPLLEGRDLLGHAPTGTGKTAAFALPLLARLDSRQKDPQVLTLTPTRELAIQVAEAFQRYAAGMPGFHVLPVYGGQDYGGQIRQLKRGVHVVVGTPGRVMDQMRKGFLRLEGLKALVLDEADEMLRMGFLEEVEWILEQTPEGRQMALFSATMPKEIERIARRHLNDPHQISIKTKTATAETVRQRYWMVSGLHKLDALTRILEVEPTEAVLVFVRTKTATGDLAERLAARGYSAAALNGDMEQRQREQTIERLRNGKLDILVATDVAARGLDVERISHVVNFDIPNDTEAYIHRIGRTGRAGRKGEAILFVAPRERRLLGAIEKATRQRMELLELPSTETVNNRRIAAFKQKIGDTLAAGDLAFMQGIVEQYQLEHDVPALEIAAALAKMTVGDKPLLLEPDRKRPDRQERDERDDRRERGRREGRDSRSERNDRGERGRHRERGEGGDDAGRRRSPPPEGMERFRIEVGRAHGVEPRNIVGAIANEAGLDGKHIGAIAIEEDHSFVDLPAGMPREIFHDLKKAWVCGLQLRISRPSDGPPPASKRPTRPKKGKHRERKQHRDG
jgi:ATP-dependent RNA helicase DeaD